MTSINGVITTAIIMVGGGVSDIESKTRAVTLVSWLVYVNITTTIIIDICIFD